MANIGQLAYGTGLDSLNEPLTKARLSEVESLVNVMIRRLTEISSTQSHPSMFKVYNGSERHGRIRAIAKDLVEAANAALIETQTTRRCSDTLVARVVKLLHGFGEEIGQFSPADGKYYMSRLCDKCATFLKEFNNNLLTNMIQLLESPATIASPRLLDAARIIDAAPVSTLQLATETWEVWAGQGKEAILEVQRISDGIFDEGNDVDEHNYVDNHRHITPTERSLAAKVFLLCRLVKTMVRKIRLRCIQPIFEPIESIDEILWLDELMEAGEVLFPAIDEIATAVIPVQVPSHICAESVNLVRIAQKVCELGWQQASQDEHQKWFVNCHAQLDSLLIPILESNPTR